MYRIITEITATQISTDIYNDDDLVVAQQAIASTPERSAEVTGCVQALEAAEMVAVQRQWDYENGVTSEAPDSAWEAAAGAAQDLARLMGWPMDPAAYKSRA